MRRLLILLAAVAVLLAPAAEARDPRPGKRPPAQGEQAKPPAPAQRGERPARPDRARGGHHRLTQEERRELNRDLDRAYREIYRRR